MNEIAIFLIVLALAAHAREIELQKEAMRKEAQSKSFKTLGSPTLRPCGQVPIMQPL